MAARKRSAVARASAATKSSTTATAQTANSKRRKPNTQPLGLKLVDDDSNPDSPVVRLYVGNILGRKPSKPTPSNIVTPVRHVDIGIADLHIPRKLLQVTRVTAQSLELDVFLDQNERNPDKAARNHAKNAALAADICQIVRGGKVIRGSAGNTIVLEQHDVFQIAKTCKACTFSYQFQVLPVAEERVAISEEEVEVEVEPKDLKIAEQDHALQKELDGLEKKLGFRPYRPTRPMGSTSCNTLNIANLASAASKSNASHNEANPEEHDSDSEAEEEEEVETKKKKESTMHATLASTYSKALCTSTPHFGSSLLELVLQKNDLPTPQLLEDLVKLMTFGPTYGDLAFMEGNRLQLALKYIQELLQRNEMHLRFQQAVEKLQGAHYWRLLLDQLTVLPYSQFTAMSEKVQKGEPTSLEQSLDMRLLQSLELHAISLQFFLLLLQGDIMLQLVRQDSKQVARHVAQTMAHVWVSRGYYLLGDDGPILANAMDQVTRLLCQVLHQVTNFETLKEQDLVDMLWSAMDERFRQTEEEEAKTNKRKLVLAWILQLEDLHSRHGKWETVTDGLVKRARLRKEYNALSKV